jgi:CDP-diacylglycerol---serine O-phosphatidyltransferase
MNRNTATWFTMGNVAAGILSAKLFKHKKPGLAVTAIVASGILDVLDGWAARKSGSVGKRGSMLDSIADMSSFGLVPSYILLHVKDSRFLRFVATLYTIAIAFRLVRFAHQEGKNGVFVGMPSPAIAIATAGACATSSRYPKLGWLAPIIALTFAGLGASELPYGKISHPSQNLMSRPFRILLYGGHVVLFLFQPGLAAISLMIIYAFLGPALMRKYHRLEQDDSRSGVEHHEGDR